jgi:hypothetical protein
VGGGNLVSSIDTGGRSGTVQDGRLVSPYLGRFRFQHTHTHTLTHTLTHTHCAADRKPAHDHDLRLLFSFDFSGQKKFTKTPGRKKNRHPNVAKSKNWTMAPDSSDASIMQIDRRSRHRFHSLGQNRNSFRFSRDVHVLTRSQPSNN